MRLNAQIGGKMYSLLLVDDERLELETLRDYIAWDELGFDRVYTARGGRDGYDNGHSYAGYERYRTGEAAVCGRMHH